MSEPMTADALLATLTEDDLTYDYPVAMSGEPMDPVLFVRWDVIAAALDAARTPALEHSCPQCRRVATRRSRAALATPPEPVR